MSKACHFCAEEIQDAAIVCKHCNRDLLQLNDPLPQSAPQETIGEAKTPGSSQSTVKQIAGGVLLFAGLAAAAVGVYAIRKPVPEAHALFAETTPARASSEEMNATVGNESGSAADSSENRNTDDTQQDQCALLKQAFDEADARVSQGCLTCMQDRAHAQIAQVKKGCPQSQPARSQSNSREPSQGLQEEATDAAAPAPTGITNDAGNTGATDAAMDAASGGATDAYTDVAAPANIPQSHQAPNPAETSADRQIVLSGQYDYLSDEISLDMRGNAICFYPDKPSRKLLSGMSRSNSSTSFCFANAQTAFRLFGINPRRQIGSCGFQGTATIAVSDYVKAQGEGDDSDAATLGRVISKSAPTAITKCDG